MAVDQTPYSTVSLDQDVPFDEQPVKESLMPNPSIKIQVLSQAIDLVTPELNTMVKELGHITMDFFALPMFEVHAI